MVICPRNLAALAFLAVLAGCGGDDNPHSNGSAQDVTGGDDNAPIYDGGDSDDQGDSVSGGDTTSAGDDDGGTPDTAAHICKDVYDKLVGCCAPFAWKTKTAFMKQCQADPFTAQQRDQFVAMSCASLAPLCSVGNVCPASTSCSPIGVGIGVCADGGYYPDDAAPCDISTDCNSGLACYGDGTTNYCVQTCIPAGGGYTVGQCPDDLTCIRLSDGKHVCGDGNSVPSGADPCTDRTDCDSGWSCVVASADAPTGFCLEQCIGD